MILNFVFLISTLVFDMYYVLSKYVLNIWQHRNVSGGIFFFFLICQFGRNFWSSNQAFSFGSARDQTQGFTNAREGALPLTYITSPLTEFLEAF